MQIDPIQRLAERIRQMLISRAKRELEINTIAMTQRVDEWSIQQAINAGIIKGWWVNYPPGSLTLTPKGGALNQD